MMVEVPMPVCQKPPEDDRRKYVASVIESGWFWSVVCVLTLVDLTLFAWQNWGETTASARDEMRTVELMISTLFVAELALRCYAHDRDKLLCATNLFDAAIILAAFVLSLVEVYTPLLAARAARFIHFGAASTRCGRAARNTTRSAVEMRNFFDRAGKGLAASVAARASERDIAPLFVDLSTSPELKAVFETRPWDSRRRPQAEETLSLLETPVLAASASVKRLARAEIDNAAAVRLAFRAKEQHRKNKPPDLEAAHSQQPNQDDSSKAVLTSARALIAVLEHALADARAKGAPPPRLLGGTLRANLVFLNRDI